MSFRFDAPDTDKAHVTATTELPELIRRAAAYLDLYIARLQGGEDIEPGKLQMVINIVRSHLSKLLDSGLLTTEEDYEVLSQHTHRYIDVVPMLLNISSTPNDELLEALQNLSESYHAVVELLESKKVYKNASSGEYLQYTSNSYDPLPEQEGPQSYGQTQQPYASGGRPVRNRTGKTKRMSPTTKGKKASPAVTKGKRASQATKGKRASPAVTKGKRASQATKGKRASPAVTKGKKAGPTATKGKRPVRRRQREKRPFRRRSRKRAIVLVVAGRRHPLPKSDDPTCTRPPRPT